MRRSTHRSSLRTKVVAFGILLVASVIGNVSLSASRSRADVTESHLIAVAGDGSGMSSNFMSPRGYARLAESEASALGAEVASSATDDGRIVPAIYSWDPDVTFVFYRHVTKWM